MEAWEGEEEVVERTEEILVSMVEDGEVVERTEEILVSMVEDGEVVERPEEILVSMVEDGGVVERPEEILVSMVEDGEVVDSSLHQGEALLLEEAVNTVIIDSQVHLVYAPATNLQCLGFKI
jgi:hypothetical protein